MKRKTSLPWACITYVTPSLEMLVCIYTKACIVYMPIDDMKIDIPSFTTSSEENLFDGKNETLSHILLAFSYFGAMLEP